MAVLSSSGIGAAGQQPAATQAAQATRVPRTADGKPDFSGIWQVLNTASWDILPHAASIDGPGGPGIVAGGELPYLPSALAQKDDNYRNRKTADTDAKCFLPGVPRVMYQPYPFQIFQTPTVVRMAFEYGHATRNVYMNTPHPDGSIEWRMGDSRGRWDGDTLVVDVVHFSGETWFDRAGNYHSARMHVAERYAFLDPDHIQYEATIEDPGVFSRPWTIRMILYRHLESDFQLLEYECLTFVDEAAGNLAPPTPDRPSPAGRTVPSAAAAPAAAVASPAAARPELTIAGQWANGGDGGAGQSNYTLEFGFPEEHAALMNVPSTRRSVIVDPPDGKIPFQPWAMAIREARDRIHADFEHMKSKDLDSQAKCYPTGVPRFANRGGPFITLFPDYVLVQIEYGHEFRVVYTDARPRLPKQIKLWNGDSRGHWEGSTFVVETTNLNGYAWLDVIGSFLSDQATIVERFTPLDAKTLRWTGTVTDPTVFTRPWTMAWNYVRNPGQGSEAEIWEFACAEGNNFKAWDDIYARELAPGPR